MKTIVLDWDALEPEIKPQAMLEEYRRLLEAELKDLLSRSKLSHVKACPGCGSSHSAAAFTKFALAYLECEDCGSVFASPRPDEAALTGFFRDSQAARFWRERILPATRESRKNKLIRPRAQWLLDVVDEYRPASELAVAVGYHNDLLMEALADKEKHLFRTVITNPAADLEFGGADLPAVTVSPTPLSEVAGIGPADLFLAFDIIDRAADPRAVFAAARDGLAPGGLFLGTTTLISGFDLQVLWDRSPTIYPPERLNLFSIEGLTALYESYGFEALELSTPGMFDVEIVKRAIEAEPQSEWPRFIRYLTRYRGDNTLGDFQEFLQRHRLSSHARVVLRKSD